MTKKRTTLTIDEEVLRAVKIRAARTGKGKSEVIEEAVRKELGLDLMERLWARNKMTEEEAMALAIEEQDALRKETKHEQPAPRPPRQPDPSLITYLEGGEASDRSANVEAKGQQKA